jgi:hypothetical protein
MTLTTRTLLAAAALTLGLTPALAQQQNAISYQGQLSNNGVPANGVYDIRFGVYGLDTGGIALASGCVDNVNVVDGLFTVQVDLGVLIQTAPRWMQIEVRPDGGASCGSGTGFTPLLPRQRVAATPWATHAGRAFGLSNPSSGGPVLNVDAGGQVVIGGVSPLAMLDVRAGTGSYVRVDTPNGDLRFNGGTDGVFGFYNEAAASGRTEFLSAAGVTMAIANGTGNVGIGTAPTANKLQVNGQIGLPRTLRTKAIHGSAFTPQYLNNPSFGTQGGLTIIDSFGTSNSGTYGSPGSSGPGVFFAPLDLPDGCVLEECIIDCRDQNSSHDARLSIGRINLNTGLCEEIATTFTSGSSSAIQHASIWPINVGVNNNTHVHFLRLTMTTTGGTEWLLAARVKYSIDTPLP